MMYRFFNIDPCLSYDRDLKATESFFIKCLLLWVTVLELFMKASKTTGIWSRQRICNLEIVFQSRIALSVMWEYH